MINTIVQIAKEAGAVILKYGPSEVDIKNKDPYDYVTKADIESDAYIRKRLREEFPDDFILSEEKKSRGIDYSQRVWIVDPLDGTKNFVHHGDGFSVMIGLCVDGAPVLGVVYAPARNILYYAEKGKGAYRVVDSHETRLKVSTIDRLDQARLVVRDTFGEEKPEVRPLDSIVERLQVSKRISEVSVGLKFGLIASNKADIHVMTNNKGSKWDTCAPQIILEEAGGKVTDIDGKPLDYKQDSLRWENMFIASNTRLHDPLVQAVRELRR